MIEQVDVHRCRRQLLIGDLVEESGLGALVADRGRESALDAGPPGGVHIRVIGWDEVFQLTEQVVLSLAEFDQFSQELCLAGGEFGIDARRGTGLGGQRFAGGPEHALFEGG